MKKEKRKSSYVSWEGEMFFHDARIEVQRGQYGNAVACILMDVLPTKVVNTLTCFNIGRLTGSKLLTNKEVPKVTVNDLMDAMRVEDK